LSAKRIGQASLRRALALCILGCVGLTAACNLEMRDNSRVKPLEPSPVFADGRSSRPRIEGTVSHRQQAQLDPAVLTGMGDDGQPIANVPIPITAELLETGRKQYNIYCSMCHGADGYGNGMIVRRGFPQPPSYHIERLRRAPVGHIYDVITNGYGVMYSYNDRIQTPEERWAVAAYVRALQYSQHAAASDLAPDELSKVQSK
jgi:mono/diheme cytochrome c family protein